MFLLRVMSSGNITELYCDKEVFATGVKGSGDAESTILILYSQ